MTRKARPVKGPRWTPKDLHNLRRQAEMGLNADQVSANMRPSWIEVVQKAKAVGIALSPVFKTSFVYGETDEAYWNTGMPWRQTELRDLRYASAHEQTLDEVSVFLMRTPADVLAKAAELHLTLKHK